MYQFFRKLKISRLKDRLKFSRNEIKDGPWRKNKIEEKRERYVGADNKTDEFYEWKVGLNIFCVCGI